MQAPTALDPVQLTPDTYVLPAFMPIPALGILPMHAFVIRGAQPVLVDTGPTPLAASFVERLSKVLDPGELRYVWLTHVDPDHTGALEMVLRAAPRARVVTSALAVAKLGIGPTPLPEGRAFPIEPGQRLHLGDRALYALRPPVYDAPETMIAFEDRTRTLLAADCFGTLLSAPYDRAAEIPAGQRRDGMLTWTSLDTPWLEHVSAETFERMLQPLRALDPLWVLGAHLPPARGMIDGLIGDLLQAAGQRPLSGLGQAMAEARS